MSRSVEIAGALLRRRSFRAGGAALLLLGLGAGSLPLLEAPGWELGQAGSLLAALLAPFAGIAAFRIERGREDASPAAAAAGGALALLTLLGAFAGGVLLRAALGPCAVLSSALGFVPLLAIPSALLGTSLAVAAALLARGRAAGTALLYALALLASLGVSLFRAWSGPAAFVADPLLGLWPGPLYDEALVPDLRAVLFRAGALAGAIAVAALAEGWARAARYGARAALAPAVVLSFLAAAGAAAGARAAQGALGISGEREDVARVLGGRREGAHCTLLHPAEKPEAAAAALLAECEFQAADVARALGIEAPPRVTAFVYRSAAEKRRLVGAAGTEYSKPWLGELHVVDGPLPLPAFRHEVVHAIAAGAARGPLRVPAYAFVLPSLGLVEGLAVALESPRSAWTVHEWSRAARDEGLLPDVRGLFGTAGFARQPPARAYTAAGSFLRFLLERHGPGPVREAYRTGDVGAALGRPLGELAAEWERFLDGVEPPPGLSLAARARMSRGSVFSRTCAREIAATQGRAWAAASAGRTSEACALLERAAELSGSAWDAKAAGDVRARAGDLDGAEAAYHAAERVAAEDDGAVRAALAAALGDLAWRRGEIAAAVSGWTAALATRPDRAEARLLRAKIAAAGDAELGPAARDWLLGEGDASLSLARLARVDRPLSAYLLGRALLSRGESAAAVPELGRAAAGGLPEILAREASFLLGQARCEAGDRGRGEATLRALLAGGSAADRERIDEALRRCAFR